MIDCPNESVFLSALRRRYRKIGGVFVPQTVSTGLMNAPSIWATRYGVSISMDSHDPKSLADFFLHLDMLHELNHYLTFRSTSYGMNYIIKQAKALSSFLNLSREKYSDTAFSDDLLSILEYRFLSEFDMKIFHKEDSDSSEGIYSVPYHYTLNSPPTEVYDHIELNNILHSHSLTPNTAYFYHRNGISTYCNSAILFEGMALACEFHNIRKLLRNLGMGNKELLCAIREYAPTESTICFETYFSHSLSDEFVEYQMAALIDIALMQSEKGSFEIFFTACQAAQNITQLRSSETKELQRFQDDVCEYLNLQKVTELAISKFNDFSKINYDWEERDRIMDNIFDGELAAEDFSKVLLHHVYNGIGVRSKDNNAYYRTYLDNDILCGARVYLGVMSDAEFNAETGDYIWLNRKNSIPLTVQSLLEKMFAGEKFSCPLREGNPTYCPRSFSEREEYCAKSARSSESFDCPYKLIEKEICFNILSLDELIMRCKNSKHQIERLVYEISNLARKQM